MPRTLIALLGDVAKAMKVIIIESEPNLFLSLAAGALVGRFAKWHVEFAADRAPAAVIGCFLAFYKQLLPLCIMCKNECANFERELCIHLLKLVEKIISASEFL